MLKISLEAARRNAKLSQKAAAKKLGVSNKTIWKWENGLAIPKADKVDAICELYAIPYDNIIFYTKDNA